MHDPVPLSLLDTADRLHQVQPYDEYSATTSNTPPFSSRVPSPSPALLSLIISKSINVSHNADPMYPIRPTPLSYTPLLPFDVSSSLPRVSTAVRVPCMMSELNRHVALGSTEEMGRRSWLRGVCPQSVHDGVAFNISVCRQRTEGLRSACWFKDGLVIRSYSPNRTTYGLSCNKSTSLARRWLLSCHLRPIADNGVYIDHDRPLLIPNSLSSLLLYLFI